MPNNWSLKGKIKVGDTVQIHYRERDYSGPRAYRSVGGAPWVDVVKEHTVTRIGTKLAYIDLHGREYGFYMDTGLSKHEFPVRRMFTPETYHEYIRDRDARAALHRATNSHGWIGLLTTEAVEAVLDIVNDPRSHR